MRLLITCPNMLNNLDAHQANLAKRGVAVDGYRGEQQLAEDDLARIVGDYDAVIVGDDPVTRRVLEAAAERVRILVKWGVGVDSIDFDAARELGVVVRNTPGALAEEVADVVIGYLVMLTRGLHLIDAGVRKGEWPKPVGISLTGRTLGVVGIGASGRAVSRRALAMGMTVLGFDVSPDQQALAAEEGIGVVDFDELVTSADVVSLHCPLTEQTSGLIGATVLDRMRRGAFLINTARGALVDEEALARALTSGQIAGAALDVFVDEPLTASSPLWGLERCIFGSHNASNTKEAADRVDQMALALVGEALGVPFDGASQ